MTCTPDPLCKWLPEEDRWETMEELAMALEEEAERDKPKPTAQHIRRQNEWLKASHRVDRMMQLAAPRKSRFAA